MSERKPKPLSPAAKDARRPPPPEQLVGALQDRIHPTSGKLLSASPVVAEESTADAYARGRREAYEAAVRVSYECEAEDWEEWARTPTQFRRLLRERVMGDAADKGWEAR